MVRQKSKKNGISSGYRWKIDGNKGQRSMFIYGLKNCDTCRKALKSLPDANFVDVRDQGVPGETLVRALDVFGATLLNSRSTTWRGLSETERARPPSELLAAYPVLMKRPLITDGKNMWLGWSAETRQALGV